MVQTQFFEGFTAEESFQQSVESATYVDQLGYHRYWLSEVMK